GGGAWAGGGGARRRGHRPEPAGTFVGLEGTPPTGGGVFWGPTGFGPAMISTVPGSTVRFMCSSQNESAAQSRVNCTVVRSPGASLTRRNPLSSLTGRVTELTR